MNYNSYLSQTVIKLNEQFMHAPADEAVKINEIIRGIKTRKPEAILKILDKQNILGHYADIYESNKNKKLNELKELIKYEFQDSPVINILIYLYIINTVKTGKTVNFNKYKKIDYLPVEIIPLETDIDWIRDAFERRPTKRRNLTIAEYAETTIIAAGKYRGVKFKNKRAPYMMRPMELLSPQSSIQEVRLMWPAQTGKTTVGEMQAMYYIQEVPSEILYVGSNAESARKWGDKRILPRVTRAGIEFRVQALDKNDKRSGNRMYSKEFDGGNLDLASALSAAALASETKRIVIADEIDRWRLELGEEGLTWDIMHARTQAWGDQKKILGITTPTTYDASMMWPLFEEGTQEEYFVPCPICKKKQILKLADGGASGLRWETKAGIIDEKSIYYICEFCGDTWLETKKHYVLNHGVWIPQAIPINKYIASFHINAIYSPFKEWYEIAQEHEKAVGDPAKMQTFTNLVMGMPYRETGSRPKLENVIELRGGYKTGEIPDGVLYLIMGVDKQTGSVKDENNPPRLEMEVLGIGAGYRTWSIDYKRFEGSIGDPFSGAWEKMHQWAVNGGLVYKRADGTPFGVKLIFIDSGDGTDNDTVYRFTGRWDSTHPIKGFNVLKKQKKEKGDEVGPSNFKRYRAVKVDEDTILYEISTNYYKTQTYNNLKISRHDSEPQSPGFCNFPRDYGEKYFKMMTSEEKKRDGSFHAGGRRNEALDVRVYALCAADVWLNNKVDLTKGWAKQTGWKESDIIKINHKYVLDMLAKQTARKVTA